MGKSMVGRSCQWKLHRFDGQEPNNRSRKLQQCTVKRETMKEREKDGFYHKPCDEERDNV